MSDDMTGSQIALLCEIEERDTFQLSGAKERDFAKLLFDGYVEPVQPGSPLKLTAKALQFLAERGAGLNEA